ncbi:MAG: hypothetical protein JJT95_18155 [Pararhodobacter sp.]|nr:hypothetical protein [Pararhodobacter sp.]
MVWSLVTLVCAALAKIAIAALAQGRRSEATAMRWRRHALVAAPCFLLALPASAQSVSYSGVSPSTFSSVGETLTVSLQVSSGNYYFTTGLQVSGWDFTSIRCPTILGQSTVTCTAEYTTTSAMNVIFSGGSYTLLRSDGGPLSGQIGGSVT